MMQCRKLFELPVVASEWQQIVWCPDCEHYALGKCSMPRSAGPEYVCSQDGKPLSLRLVTANDCNPQEWENETGYVLPEIEPCSGATEQAIQERILQRTFSQIHSLEVEVNENVVTIRGHVACFHLKQLALQGVLDVVGAGKHYGIELNIRVETIVSSEGETDEDARQPWEFVAEEESNDESSVETISTLPLLHPACRVELGHQPDALRRRLH
jgi:hypothetical protein